ncbi:ADP-ribosylglycohydrolase family protein [Paenibacillus sp. PR3]|uniref:ADP-ribosylglycohydrolase family protein n=1 Tax=Paenibacillus terricola TaxID=2763503 RepID=A0ABR8N6Q0_9BACL|nr:ADP-ribosylglycohydrolase family protein [Paenibacillus terricola]MBD3922941.1 ADP-ribosylglycohydrolase family protein [Paenibacillus terricola]
MLGAIIGDVIGSVYEWHNMKSTEFPLYSRFTRFTDDTVLTVAVADAVLSRNKQKNRLADYLASKQLYASRYRQYYHWFPDAGYGQKFEEWAKNRSSKPYRSYGNGSAMRVSPIGFASQTLEEALAESRRSAIVTHNHRHGIKGAQAVAAAIFLARHGESKAEIKDYIQRKFKYNLEQSLDEIRPTYTFDPSCQGSVPQAIIAFLESDHFEDAIRKAISIGGDSDTIACIAGGIAHAFYKEIPSEMASDVMLKLDPRFRSIIREFNSKYEIPM